MDRDPCIQADVDGRSASVIQIESSKLLPALVILAAVSSVAIICSVASWMQAKDAETETRMLEYYVMELDGKLMRDGVIDFKQSWAGRSGKERK